jgi:hypothetical protein
MQQAKGFDAAIMGVGVRCGQPDILVYDAEKIVDVLVERDGMGRKEAQECAEFNIFGAWAGNDTPIFLWRTANGRD